MESCGSATTNSASDSNFRRGKEEWFRLQRDQRQRILRPIQISSRQRRMVPPAAGFAAKSSASDSNLRRGKEEWFRLQRALLQRVPRPILIFVAAKKNGVACNPILRQGCNDS